MGVKRVRAGIERDRGDRARSSEDRVGIEPLCHFLLFLGLSPTLYPCSRNLTNLWQIMTSEYLGYNILVSFTPGYTIWMFDSICLMSLQIQRKRNLTQTFFLDIYKMSPVRRRAGWGTSKLPLKLGKTLASNDIYTDVQCFTKSCTNVTQVSNNVSDSLYVGLSWELYFIVCWQKSHLDHNCGMDSKRICHSKCISDLQP